MDMKKLSKQRIDRILSSYFDRLKSEPKIPSENSLTFDENVTALRSIENDCPQSHRRNSIVKRVLVDFEKRSSAPYQIPVRDK